MPQAGTFFRSYYVIAPLGEGGMSEVFLGYDLPHHRFVALKFLTGLFGNNASAVGRLKREGEIYRKLDHPNVVKLIDTGPLPEGGLYLVQEHLRGVSLREALEERGGPLAIPRCMAVLEDTAAALNAAHRQGIVHRDVKPDNVMIGPDGRGTVFDFGIAYRQDGLVQTQAGTIMGTMNYSSPEARDGEALGPSADIYSLGAVFYELLTGRLAIQAKTFKQLMEFSSDDVEPPSQGNPAAPPVLDDIFRRLMADDPDDRYPDLRTLLIELGKLRASEDEDLRARLFGDTPHRHAEEALAAFREGDLGLAKTTAARLLADGPPEFTADLQHLMGRIQREEGNLESAVRAFERGLGQDPMRVDIALDLAMTLMGAQAYDRATEVLKGLPTVIRGNFLVRCLLDTVQAIPEAPPSVWTAARSPGALAGLIGSLRSLWKR